MNEKIKIIDILNMIAKGELKDGTRFKVYSSCNDADSKPFICEYDKDYPGIIWCVTDDCKYNYKIDYMRILNYYVEILEDNTEEIEELDTLNAYKLMESPYMAKLLKEQRYDEFMEHLKQSEVEMANTIIKTKDKINELVKIVNQIRKEKE